MAIHNPKDTTMEKYGVDENKNQENLEKIATEGCPQCGGKVERHGQVVLCRACGSQPFEEKSKEK